MPPGEGDASSRPRNRNHRLGMAGITQIAPKKKAFSPSAGRPHRLCPALSRPLGTQGQRGGGRCSSHGTGGGRGHTGGQRSRLTVSPWGPGSPCSNMASKVALTVKCTNATQDKEATMLLLPGRGTNATRHRNTTQMEATAASVTAHPPLAGRAWHALLLGVIFLLLYDLIGGGFVLIRGGKSGRWGALER